MSKIFNSVWRLLARWSTAPRAPATPETMTLHDWADLPPYHPICEPTPR